MLVDQSSFFSTASHMSLSNIMDAMGPERHYRPGLVGSHQSAAAENIGSEDGGQPALLTRFAHETRSWLLHGRASSLEELSRSLNRDIEMTVCG
jgi:hypothetical protein